MSKISTVAPGEGGMRITEHLSELAKRLKVIVISLLVAGGVVSFWPVDLRGFLQPFTLYRPLVSVIMVRMKEDFLPTSAMLIAGGPLDTIFVYMYLSLLIGVALSSPIIGYELYAYVRPALYPQERKHVLEFVASFFGLFTFGIAMAYFLILPLTFRILIWFISSGGALPLINIKDFYNVILTLMLASGLFYTIPVFVVLLVQFGILPASFISGRRKIVYVALFIILTIITPDPTPLTATIILIPYILVFEVAVVAAKRVDKRRSVAYTSSQEKISYLKCKFCGGLLNPSSATFCDACGKCQV